MDAPGRGLLADDLADDLGCAVRCADRQLGTGLRARPAGRALADVLDRRRVVLATQVWQLLLAGALGTLTLAHVTTPALLLVMTAALAVGSALGLPAFGSLTPELVPRAELAPAISLNSMVLTASQGDRPGDRRPAGRVARRRGGFVLNAVSFLAVVAVVAAWRRPRLAPGLPPEHVSSAIRTGLRYVANRARVPVVLIRAALTSCRSARSGVACGVHALAAARHGLRLRPAARCARHRRSLRRADPAACSRPGGPPTG